ncbi:MAG: kinase/pyrophosphorylase [Gammaproteobacteria bacterium]|nr:MAG: kinase/pyrophosphorylase [Gammaproteobacteria bacterium]
MSRTVFYISDGTGITAETLGHSLLTQFDQLDFKQTRIPFVDSEERAWEAVEMINDAAAKDGTRAIVFNTVVNSLLCDVLANSNALFLDVFGTFLAPLEQELDTQRSPHVGHAHGLIDFDRYDQRINAMNYTLSNDDGAGGEYDEADVILVGVSRSGKTPTSLYMALHHGMNAANYPLVDEDLHTHRLPAVLRAHKAKMFGLTIDPERLHQIRQERRPDSRYAGLQQCRREVAEAEQLFEQEGIPYINSTQMSIEEMAGKVMLGLGLERELY